MGRAIALVDAADALTNGMDPAPWLRAGVLHGRAQIALDRGESAELVVHARELGDLAAANSFATMAIDALEFEASAPGGAPDVAAQLLTEARAERERIGYRWRACTAPVDLRDGADAHL